MSSQNYYLLLVVVFGSSAWIGTNSVWMQLPLITASLPEGWSLPSYLATVVQVSRRTSLVLYNPVGLSKFIFLQIACIAPLIYGIIHKCYPKVNLQPSKLILVFLSIACLCQLGRFHKGFSNNIIYRTRIPLVKDG